jgi:hypothetical protein
MHSGNGKYTGKKRSENRQKAASTSVGICRSVGKFVHVSLFNVCGVNIAFLYNLYFLLFCW